MADIPRAVLSEQFQERMNGRRLRAAVFLTFQFDPGFFEQEVLPVFLDVPLSHAKPIRLVQLEDTLRRRSVAVYYDANGLQQGNESAKLDVRRIPLRHGTGIFHAKNVFVLAEDEEANEEGRRSRTLLAASLSANLTRSGWWENVEACHIEEIAEGDSTRLKDDLADLLLKVRQKSPTGTDNEALNEVLAFLRSTDQRAQKSAAGQLHTHFYNGSEPLADFLSRIAGQVLTGMSLDVISPYFDAADTCAPLAELVDRLRPKQVRVYLPRSRKGEVTCRQELFESVREMNVEWGYLPKELLRKGKDEDVEERFVHAKVYRFFSLRPKREICFIGSANLTTAAHQNGGNWETGFLVDYTPPRQPAFWLEPMAPDHQPSFGPVETEESDAVATRGTPLNLRYHWDQARAEVYWDAPKPSPHLLLSGRGVPVGELSDLPPREWRQVEAEMSARIGQRLTETSFFEVRQGEEKAWLLVQEEGMSHKPSIFHDLSAADILRYWALLTADQRAAFLDAHAPDIALTGEGADLVAKAKITHDVSTVFDRFAGFFHAFGCLERAVREAIQSKKLKDANYRLFGRKYDSLGSLLDRVSKETTGDGVDQYVLLMCARQLCRELSGEFPDFQKEQMTALKTRCQELAAGVRQRLREQNPDADFGTFLDWFDGWFLKRAAPVGEES